LPDVAVTPSEHFNTVLYTGTGSELAVTGVGFQPDFTWTKSRSNSLNHNIYDAIRGATKMLKPNLGVEEGTDAQSLKSFDSDGFTVGTDTHINTNNATFVSWNWKANGSGSSNTNGSINSTVSVNTDAGFSIVSYTGTGSNATVGHGLSKAPEMYIVKDRDQDMHWLVYHKDLTSAAYFFKWDNEQAQASDGTKWNSTDPTASVFSIGTETGVNESGHDYIAYCFHSVEGYCAVGSYEGNGNADGVFVYLGFRPARVMVRNVDSGGNAYNFDTKRIGYNPKNWYQGTAYAGGENTSDENIDLLSNGFKFRSSNSEQNGTNTQVYIAWAETPFKYSNAR
jgi:hypothetical protein